MRNFMNGFKDELVKESSLTAAGVAAALGGTAKSLAAGVGLKNLVFHTLINVANLPKLKKALGEQGHEFMRVGFRHGLLDKKVAQKLWSPVPTTIGALAGPAPMYMYDEGWRYGKQVRDVMKKIPFAKPDSPFKAIARGDDAAQLALKHAPIGGAAAGGTYGYYTGRTKKERYPVKAILAGALTGGLLGKGGKAIGPKAPPIKQLHDIRTKFIDPVLKDTPTKVTRLLDPIAK